MKDANHIAEIILKGFRRHYSLFQLLTAKAKDFFEHAEWQALRQSSADRITYYDIRVTETIDLLKAHFPQLQPDENLWQEVRARYAATIRFHPQVELAETFYNSVFCNIFHRKYYHNKNIFVETTLDHENLPAPIASVYRSYFPAQQGLKKTIKHIIHAFDFTIPYENLNRDIRFIIKSFKNQSQYSKHLLHEIRFDILNPLFIRNKAAYLIGRVVTPSGQQPFIVPLLNRETPHAKQPYALYADALITNNQQMSIIFGFYHAYFFVETTVPSALIHFLKELMPEKTLSDLYAAVGLHKQSKTEFYRALLHHLKDTKDKFVIAPGVPGMVMSVFTLPHYPYVFKVIRDEFAPSKTFTAETVKQRYLLVKKHDRVGRMADTLEYSDVALPRNRISNELLAELREKVPSSLREEKDIIVIKHLYIERRMIPMNIYLKDADDEEKKNHHE